MTRVPVLEDYQHVEMFANMFPTLLFPYGMKFLQGINLIEIYLLMIHNHDMNKINEALINSRHQTAMFSSKTQNFILLRM